MYSSHSMKLFRHIIINDAENTVNIYVWIYDGLYNVENMKTVAVEQMKNNCCPNRTIGPPARLGCFTLGCQPTNLPTNAPAAPPHESMERHAILILVHLFYAFPFTRHLKVLTCRVHTDSVITSYTWRINSLRLGGQRVQERSEWLVSSAASSQNDTLLHAHGFFCGLKYLFLFVQIFMSAVPLD